MSVGTVFGTTSQVVPRYAEVARRSYFCSRQQTRVHRESNDALYLARDLLTLGTDPVCARRRTP